jgi:hypothetical protein
VLPGLSVCGCPSAKAGNMCSWSAAGQTMPSAAVCMAFRGIHTGKQSAGMSTISSVFVLTKQTGSLLIMCFCVSSYLRGRPSWGSRSWVWSGTCRTVDLMWGPGRVHAEYHLSHAADLQGPHSLTPMAMPTSRVAPKATAALEP